MEMRKAFSNYLLEAMAEDERLCVLDADLGNANATLKLREKYPGRAFDVGIAEQNMASIAAGLSSYGFIPFITTFACFASRRICDQVAISCAYAKQNVKIVGTDPGITAELNGGTHMAIEDFGVLRSIPGILLFLICEQYIHALFKLLKLCITVFDQLQTFLKQLDRILQFDLVAVQRFDDHIQSLHRLFKCFLLCHGSSPSLSAVRASRRRESECAPDRLPAAAGHF